MPKNNNSPVDKNKSFSIQPSHILVNWDANEPNDVNDREDCAHLYNTVIPRLTRLEWQPKNRVKRNSRYASQSIKKNCQKNLHNAEILYYKIVLCKFFWTNSKNRVI